MVVTIPNPKNPLQPLSYDLTSILAAEARVPEIAFLSTTKAGELFSVFVKACFDLARMYSEIQLQSRYAERRSDIRRAVVLLEVVPAVVTDKKLGSNAEIREAIVDTDMQYNAAVSEGFEIEALLALVKGKLAAMEEALNAAKKVLADTQPAFIRNNPDLITSQLNQDYKPSETRQINSVTVGKAKY